MKGESGVDPGFSFSCLVEDKRRGKPGRLPSSEQDEVSDGDLEEIVVLREHVDRVAGLDEGFGHDIVLVKVSRVHGLAVSGHLVDDGRTPCTPVVEEVEVSSGIDETGELVVVATGDRGNLS